MSLYPTIFLPCFSEKQAERAVTAAAPVAQSFGSLVVGCHGTPPPHVAVPAVYPLESGAHIQEIIDAVAKANKAENNAIQGSFVKACRNAGLSYSEKPDVAARVSATWRGPTGLIPDIYVNEAMTCDLTVIAQEAETTPSNEINIYTSILMGSGKPILLLPAGQSLGVPDKIIVGWNSSLEVSRAVHAARPLFKEASQVTLLTVSHDDIPPPEVPSALAALSRHGVRATHDQVVPEGRVSDTLQNHTRTAQAELLILGGYSHSRLRELVLGGVTRSVLQDAKLPILLCH